MIKNKIGILLLALSVFMFTACEDETVKPFEEASLDAAYLTLGAASPNFFNKGDYDNAAATFNVTATGENGVSVNSVDVIMYFLSAPGQANQGPFNVGTISSSSGDFTTSLKDLTETALGLTQDDIDVGATFTFFFEMQTSAGTIVQGGPASARSISIPVSCPSDLAGTYSTVATYAQHDFIANGYTENTEMNVEITEEAPGVYSVVDISGGLYATGPYNVEYGSTGLPFTFTEVCSSITWSEQNDDWQPIVPNENGVNAVDPVTGVITISWLGETYGEETTIVFTPM